MVVVTGGGATVYVYVPMQQQLRAGWFECCNQTKSLQSVFTNNVRCEDNNKEQTEGDNQVEVIYFGEKSRVQLTRGYTFNDQSDEAHIDL